MHHSERLRTVRMWLVAGLTAWTVLIPLRAGAVSVNPDPTQFGPDNGASLFQVSSQFVISLKAADYGGLFAGTSEFGFYYAAAPSVHVPLFGSNDMAATTQVAAADFTTGTLYDVDRGVVTGHFLAVPLDIGFYYTVFGQTYYTSPGLNPGGEDLAAVFPYLADPKFSLFAFNAPGSNVGLSYFIAEGITPVPLPNSVWLMLSGLAVMVGWGWLKRSRVAAPAAWAA